MNEQAKKYLTIAGISGALAVAIGAFGAHGLKAHLQALGRTDTFETAVKYHFYHTFALLAVGILMLKLDSKYLVWAANGFVTGIILFSGSLYVLCIGMELSYFGTVTPVGGLFLIAAWVLTVISVRKATLR